MYTCPKCPETYEKLISLSLHFRSRHKLTAKELYVTMFANGVVPTCKCGCGEETKYLGIEAGFRDYKIGHIARINNPRTDEGTAKAHETYRQRIAMGEIQAWNKGLSKETDERVKANGEAASETKRANSEQIKEYSERMKQMRGDGTIPTLFGVESSQWKGGYSALQNVCNNHKILYDQWKYPKLVISGFKCTNCSNVNDLQVHHDKERMAEITRRIAFDMGWELLVTTKIESTPEVQDLKIKIAEAVAKYHVDNDVSAKVLCKICHKLEHESMNF